MSVGTLVTEGIGSFGDIAHVITDGLDISATVVTAPGTILTEGFGSLATASAFVVTEGFSSSVVTVTPKAVVGGGGGSRRARRRRFLLPDGKLILATLDELYEILDECFRLPEPVIEGKKPIVIRSLGKVSRPKLVRLESGIEKVKLPKSVRWKPDPIWYALALKALREREEEEIVIMLAIH